MRSKLLISISGFVMVLALGFGVAIFSPTTSAFEVKPPSCPEGSVICETNPTKNPIYGPDGIITKVTQVLTVFVGVVAVFVLVLAGISMMTSGGEPNKIATARRMVLYACIGIVVAVLGQAIVSFVLTKL